MPVTSEEKRKAPRVGRMAKTTRFVQGTPFGITTGQFVDVVAKQNGRYQVSNNGNLLWVDADALEALS